MPGEDIYSWSTSATLNGNADTSINWAEGQPRASVNNSSRSQMAAHAKQRDQQNGSIVTGGTANAQTFFSGNNYTTVPTGMRVLLKIGPSLTNTDAATLNMDNIGDVAIKDQAGAELEGGELDENSYQEFLYDGTNWIFLEQAHLITQIEVITTVETIIDGTTVVEFTTGIDDRFYQFIFMLTNFVPTVDDRRLVIQFSSDGGTTYLTAPNYRWTRYVIGTAQATGVTQDTLTGGGVGQNFIAVGHTVSNVANDPMAGEVRLYRPWSVGPRVITQSQMSSFDSVRGDIRYSVGSGAYVGGLAINAVRFLFESGNIKSGTVVLYGVGRRVVP